MWLLALGIIVIALYVMSTKSKRDGWDELNQEEKQQLVEEVQEIERHVDEMNVSLKNAVKCLRAAAEYLDQVWKDCKIASAVGTSAGITGGVLTALGGVATVMTAGAASPLLVAGTAFGVAGASTKLGTIAVESIIKSSVIHEADKAVEDVNRVTQKVKKLILGLKTGKSVAQLAFLGNVIGRLDKNLLVLSYLKSFAGFLAAAPSSIVTTLKAGAETASGVVERIVAKGGSKAITKAGTEAAFEGAGSMVAKGGTKGVTKAGIESALTKGGSTPVGKAGAQGGAKAGGTFIIGVSVFFLIVDAIDLAFTVRDIVENKGSEAAESIRDKADEYEAILNRKKGK